MVNLAKHIKLTRPLMVLDVETTGGNPDLDRIWQISITKHYPHKEPGRWTEYINPQREIPKETVDALEISPFVLKKIAHAAPFSHYGAELAREVFTGCDYMGFYVLFDLRVMRKEFERLELKWNWELTDSRVICSHRIYQILFPRDLQAAYKEFVDKRGFKGAHEADKDVRATEEVLQGQLTHALFPSNLPRTVESLSDYCFPKDPHALDRRGRIVWRNGEACIGFGKHQGRTLTSMVNNDEFRGYLGWMLEKDFLEDTKQIIRDALKGKFPKRVDK